MEKKSGRIKNKEKLQLKILKQEFSLIFSGNDWDDDVSHLKF